VSHILPGVSLPDQKGTEPDPRFTLANERTFLAWIRTSLALLATGLAIAEFLKSQPRGVRLVIGIPLILLASVVAFRSYGRWEAVQQAMRQGRPLPGSHVPALVGGTIAVMAIVTAILLVVNP
jgi:putative membrane protein